eukprot:COSAG05_NODE_5119_length_1259_cov_1.492241_2_plen_77_part_00
MRMEDGGYRTELRAASVWEPGVGHAQRPSLVGVLCHELINNAALGVASDSPTVSQNGKFSARCRCACASLSTLRVS